MGLDDDSQRNIIEMLDCANVLHVGKTSPRTSIDDFTRGKMEELRVRYTKDEKVVNNSSSASEIDSYHELSEPLLIPLLT